MVACPNDGACQGDRSALLACQNATYMPLTTSGQLQLTPNNCSLESAVDSTDQLVYIRQQCTSGYYGPCAPCVSDKPAMAVRTAELAPGLANAADTMAPSLWPILTALCLCCCSWTTQFE
ncbi:TPA: hypothetical protein ACH3X1_010717 [Trebouxia sp. C0004]